MRPRSRPRLELTLKFPKSFESETFHIKLEKKLSPLAKSILQSAQFKHFYYMRDDLDYLLKSNPVERNFLLQGLYSIVISLQNNLSIDFFNMWIYEIYINKIPMRNKFINQKSQNLNPKEYLTIKLAYGDRVSKRSSRIESEEIYYEWIAKYKNFC
jgi:hypothetical protein